MSRSSRPQTVAHMHVIEFQKRGLPHAHILIIFREEDRLRTPEDFDSVTCAELPDKDTQPRLFEIVTEHAHMYHGPCGEAWPNAPCMHDGHCEDL